MLLRSVCHQVSKQADNFVNPAALHAICQLHDAILLVQFY